MCCMSFPFVRLVRWLELQAIQRVRSGSYRLPKEPQEVWPEEWQGWDDWLGTMLPFEEAQAAVHGAEIESESAYRAFKTEGSSDIAARLPLQPDKYYKSIWAGWADFLGQTLPPPSPPPPPPQIRRSPPPIMTSMGAGPAAISDSWPPAGADANAEWVDGKDAGPLGHAVDNHFESLFRQALVRELGRDVAAPGYAGVIDLVRALVAEGRADTDVSAASRRVLLSLFPDLPPKPPPALQSKTISKNRPGLLFWFEVLFAKPFPGFSAQLNAWVTWWAGQWLMGPCSIEDVDADDLVLLGDGTGRGTRQQLLVQRCRFLESSACASVCVNACKIPTQRFFNEDMGVPMRMVPDYETLQCRFQFGVPPTLADEAEARSVPCFSACPTAAGGMRGKLQRQQGHGQQAVQQCSSMGGPPADRC